MVFGHERVEWYGDHMENGVDLMSQHHRAYEGSHEQRIGYTAPDGTPRSSDSWQRSDASRHDSLQPAGSGHRAVSVHTWRDRDGATEEPNPRYSTRGSHRYPSPSPDRRSLDWNTCRSRDDSIGSHYSDRQSRSSRESRALIRQVCRRAYYHSPSRSRSSRGPVPSSAGSLQARRDSSLPDQMDFVMTERDRDYQAPTAMTSSSPFLRPVSSVSVYSTSPPKYSLSVSTGPEPSFHSTPTTGPHFLPLTQSPSPRIPANMNPYTCHRCGASPLKAPWSFSRAADSDDYSDMDVGYAEYNSYNATGGFAIDLQHMSGLGTPSHEFGREDEEGAIFDKEIFEDNRTDRDRWHTGMSSFKEPEEVNRGTWNEAICDDSVGDSFDGLGVRATHTLRS